MAILPRAQGESRTLTVRAAMPNPRLRLKPGMFAQVAFAPDGAKPCWSRPKP